jgi:hypothetical protein
MTTTIQAERTATGNGVVPSRGPSNWKENVRVTTKTLPVAAMKLHPDIQRFRHTQHPHRRGARIQYLYDHWDDVKAGLFVVVPGDSGEWLVCRGGHRLEVRRLRGDAAQLCLVVEGLDLTKDTQMAYLVDVVLSQEDSRRWTVMNEYLLRSEFGLMPEAEIESILHKNGARGGNGKGRIYGCPAQLRRAYARRNLFSTVFVIETAWGGFDSGAMDRRQSSAARSGVMVDAISLFLQVNEGRPYFSDEHLAQKLQGRTPLAVLGASRQRSDALKTSLVRELCEGFVLIYNHGLRSNALPTFKMPRAKS